MLRILCKSKIHGACVTESNLKYKGSITIDEKLMKDADILPNERVQIVNLNNGNRIETYAIKGKPGSRVICLNGGAARSGEVGDRLIIISYCLLDTEEARKYRPKVVLVDKDNRQKRK